MRESRETCWSWVYYFLKLFMLHTYVLLHLCIERKEKFLLHLFFLIIKMHLLCLDCGCAVASTTISPNIEQEATYAMGHNKIVLKSLLPHNLDVAKNRHIGFLRNVSLKDFVEKCIFHCTYDDVISL